MIDAELERDLREDSISIHSSVSQKNHHGHTHGGGHTHGHSFHGHSGHATPKHIRGATSGQHTPLHSYSGQHTPHHVPNLGYRHSFASMAVSLPPGLDYQPSKEIYTPTNSSFTSREDLQCTWHDLPRFDIGPVSTTAEPPLPIGEPYNHRQRAPVSNNLSSLFMHQVEQKLNQYKNMIMKSRSKTKLSNVASFLSVGSAATGGQRDPGPSVSRQASTKRKYRQSSGGGPEKPGIRRNSSSSRRSNFIFSFEDMTTDSTSVLKDTRHPSLSSVNLATSKPGPPLGRVVSLQRHPSSTSTKYVPTRPRYMSEGHDNSKDNLHSSKLFICTPTAANKSGSSLCVSMDFEYQGILAPTPITLENTADNAAEVKMFEKLKELWLIEKFCPSTPS